MKYESTGEVRRPRKGEYFINVYGSPSERIERAGVSYMNDKKVIMRPVREVKQFNIVLPFSEEERAKHFATRIANELQILGWVEPIYE